MNYKNLLPSQSERSKNLSAVMFNRRQLNLVLPKMLGVLLLELTDAKDTENIVFAKSFLSAFEYFAKNVTSDDDLSTSLIEVIGYVSDLYVKTKWNPNKDIPFETPSEILTWFCIFLLSHFTKSELLWESKIGKNVVDHFAKLKLDPAPLKFEKTVEQTGSKKIEYHEYSPAST